MPVFDFVCDCGWKGEMLVARFDAPPPPCPNCRKPPHRQFSPSTALFIAEPFRAENVDALRRYAHRLERDEQLQRREARAREIARRLNEQMNREPTVKRETLDKIVEAGKIR